MPICPELTAALGVPRPPAEIADGDPGSGCSRGAARVVDVTGADLTALSITGAQAALTLAREQDCGFALLAEGSPSCGSGFSYDESFAGNRQAGAGVTAALLRQHGIEVFVDTEIDALIERLRGKSERRANPCLRSFTYVPPALARQGSARVAPRKTKAAQGQSRPPRLTPAAIRLHGSRRTRPRHRAPHVKRKARRPSRHAPRCVSAQATHACR